MLLSQVCFLFVFLVIKAAQIELIEMHKDLTSSVDVLPFEDERGLPIAEIFAPLLMEEDHKAKEWTLDPGNQRGTELKDLRELFYIDDKPAKRIFMKGEAGCGKTLFCLKMLDIWCQVKESGTVTDDALQKCLNTFDLVFYLPLRHYKGNLASVKGMIDQTVSEQCLQLFANGGRIHCLVILDGLDESPTTFTELPRMHENISYALFCTTRPWKLTQLKLKFRPNDKVVKLLGLQPSSEKKVIEYVLDKFCKVKETNELKMKFQRYSSMLKESNLKSLVKFPMMLTACCCMWHEEDKHTENSKDGTPIDFPTAYTSMTYTYLCLVDSMIRRADEKCDIRSDLTQLCSDAQATLADFLYVLLPLCKLACDDLLSGETRLVFQKEELEGKLGHRLVQIALRIGLISQTRAPCAFRRQNLSVNFYHKSVQEFLAAVYLTCTNIDDIRSYCTSLDNVMNVANIIMFGSALDPSFWHSVLKHVMDIAGTDPDIQQYRRTLDIQIHDRVKQFYDKQCQWYRELIHSRTLTGDTSPFPTVHVSDIYLNTSSDSDTVRLTGDIMHGTSNLHNIVSVYLYDVERQINTRVVQYLQQCPNLSALGISFMYRRQEHNQMVTFIPHLIQLQTIRYGGIDKGATTNHCAAVKAIMSLTQLTSIELVMVDLGQDELVMTGMSRLQTVMLRYVNMTPKSWGNFVTTLLHLNQVVHVVLEKTNIDYQTTLRIRNEPRLTVTQDGRKSLFKFTSAASPIL